mgnify:CR=1 FL=1
MRNLMESLLRGSSLIILLIYPFLGVTQIKSSDIDNIRIAEIELANDSLFLWLQVRPELERTDSTTGTFHKMALSSKEKTKYLKLIDKLNILSIHSNNDHKRGYFPFEVIYSHKNRIDSISAYKGGMTPLESQCFEQYISTIGEIIDYKKAKETCLLSLPDGQYQIKYPWKYQIHFGKGWESWQKKDGIVERIGVPIVILNGKKTDYEIIDKLNPKEVKSFKILKQHEADSLYGPNAKNGVILIKTK